MLSGHRHKDEGHGFQIVTEYNNLSESVFLVNVYVLVGVPIAVKSHHDHNKTYKGNYSNETLFILNFDKFICILQSRSYKRIRMPEQIRKNGFWHWFNNADS